MTWAGSWVRDRLDVRLVPPVAGGPDAVQVAELVGLAVRRNPRRAHLLVSQVLGKHVPADPHLVHAAGLALGAAVSGAGVDPSALRAAFDGRPQVLRPCTQRKAGEDTLVLGYGEDTLVLGYAETATGLGHSVAEALDAALYLHSTRRAVPGCVPAGGFSEEHSHATEHLLLPDDPGVLRGNGLLVLVDDELSTGRTVIGTIRALHALCPRPRYVVAALVDLRGADDVARLQQVAAELGTRVDVVSLARGEVALPDDVLARGARLVAEVEARQPSAAPTALPRRAVRVELPWPPALPESGRHGLTREHRVELEALLPALAAPLAQHLRGLGARDVLVLGTEELMHVPLRIATTLADQLAVRVRFSTTTRSPVLVLDDPGYPVRSRIVFPAHDGPDDQPRYAYNVRGFDAVVVVVDRAADTPELVGLTDALHTVTPHVLVAALGQVRA